MKRIINISLTLFILAAIVLLASLSISAAAKKEADGIAVTVKTDSNQYERGEDMILTIIVKNNNYYTVSDILVETVLPDLLKCEDESVLNQTFSLKAGESKTLSVTATFPSRVLLYVLIGVGVLLIAAGAVAVLFFVLKKKKSATPLVSVLLCLVLLTSIAPTGVFAQENGAKPTDALIEADARIRLNGTRCSIGVKVSYQTESVSNEVAELFGIDPNEYDSDGDGLSNYVEIYHAGTNPLMVDSNQNGVSDADEDSDGDSISNINEQTLRTNPGRADTDGDTLNDYRELSEIGSHPCDYDTDDDTLSDGDEILLGLSPLKKKTDGETLDAKRSFTQSLSEQNIDERLVSDTSEATPSLTLTTNGNINNRVYISKNESNDFSDSRAIVGEPIDIYGEELGSGTITFDLAQKDSSTVVGNSVSFYSNIVCKYNEDGTTEYLNTEYDTATLSVSAEISDGGTYYLLNVKNLFDELGLVMPDIPSIDALSGVDVSGVVSLSSGYESHTVKPLSDKGYRNGFSGSGVMAQADIVFIIDTTGSMSNEIDNVKNNVSYFVDALKDKGVSAGLALIDYQDITVDGMDSTRVHSNELTNWFYDADTYKAAISKLKVGDGGDTPECTVDALETARLLDMRPSAGKIFILVTDAGYKVDNRYEIPSMAAEIELLKNAGVTCAVVCSSSYQSAYYELYTETNGIWADINGDFYTELMLLADKIGDEIVGEGYWIYLDGPIPVPIRLDEELKEGSIVDTDKDGIPDIKELEGATPSKMIDLDELVTLVSRGIITGTDYGKVMMYRYTSNPAEPDTDFDGILDEEDTAPNNNVFSGSMEGTKNVNEASYKMDYRAFFDSSTTFNRNIAMTSLIMSNTIYDVGAFRYHGSGKRITNIKDLLALHGFDHPTVYDLKIEYTDDDVSEIGIGYHDVEYNGKKARIIAVVVRGTDATTAEWSSNFDVGNPSNWQSEYHKGFYKTKERIQKHIDEYVSLYGKGEGELIYWVTGHSRGAAIANILAANLIDKGNNVFAYTFATPSTTTSDSFDDAKYYSIFNFCNVNDIVPYVPLSQWGFHPFGVTLSFPILNEEVWCRQTGDDEYNTLSQERLVAMLATFSDGCCPTLEDVYRISTKQTIGDKKEQAISTRARRYCLIEEVYVLSVKTGYHLSPSPAFFFQLLAEILAKDNPNAWKNNKVILSEFINTDYCALIIGIAFANRDVLGELSLDVLFDTHATATYYIMLQQ